MTWGEALCHGKVWYEDCDSPRFRFAFSAIASASTKWPTPKEFMEAMPPRRIEREKPVLRIVSDEVVERSAKEKAESEIRINAIINDLADKLHTRAVKPYTEVD